MTSLTKNPKPKTKQLFFIADSKTCRVFGGFEQLSSACGTRDTPLQRHVLTAAGF